MPDSEQRIFLAYSITVSHDILRVSQSRYMNTATVPTTQYVVGGRELAPPICYANVFTNTFWSGTDHQQQWKKTNVARF